MRSKIFWVIPSEEPRFKDYFQQGAIWHNNLWFTTKKYGEILIHYKTKIQEQKDNPDQTPHEIFIIKHTETSITFSWQPPNNIFARFDKYLFNYSGVWYEFDESASFDRSKIWNRAEFTLNYSVYWNDYWYLTKANANGILYNSAHLVTEVCACPAFNQSEETIKNTFVVTGYELKWNLLQAWAGRQSGNWYALWLNSTNRHYLSRDPNFPWIQLGAWSKVDFQNQDTIQGIKEKLKDGKSEQLFSLVSQRLQLREQDDNATTITDFPKIEAWTDVEVKLENNQMTMKRGQRAKEFANWIKDEYPLELKHCLDNHVETSIVWRDKVVWKGNLYEIQSGNKLCLKLTETCNPSGTAVTFRDRYGNVIAQVHESIFIKIGKESSNNIILSTVITAGAGIAVAAITAGVGAAVAANATAATVKAAAMAGAVKGAVAGGIGTAVAGVKDKLLNYGETIRQEFTIDEFYHKFLRSGHWPVSIILEQDNELINRYHANRTLKGREGNQYFNTTSLNAFLDNAQYFKANFLTLNMWGKNKEWFENKINQGVYIGKSSWAYGERDLYRLGLPRKRMVSTGAAATGSIDTIVIRQSETTVETNRSRGTPYHQRGHYFIFYEDGTTDHWLAMYPCKEIADDLPKGHRHGAFILEFAKPVRKMVDIYTCIGCGAADTSLFDVLHSNYRNSSADSLETIYKGLPFEPWYSAMSSATASRYELTVNGVAGRLGSSGDVWEKATQQDPGGSPFTKAYGYIPNNRTITWALTISGIDETLSRTVSGELPEGFITPPLDLPSSDGVIPIVDPTAVPEDEPDPNEPVPEVNLPEIDVIPGGGTGEGLEPEPEEPEDIPEPEEPEPEPNEPEPEPEPNEPEPEPEPNEPEPGPDEPEANL